MWAGKDIGHEGNLFRNVRFWELKCHQTRVRICPMILTFSNR